MQGLAEAANPGTTADLYYYSDFQKTNFPAQPTSDAEKKIHFHGIAVQGKEAGNVFIDTAWLSTPVLLSGEPSELIVKTRLAGDAAATSPVLQLRINGQVKSAATPALSAENPTASDTLSFTVNGNAWQRMELSINDGKVPFDDTFRIAAQSAPGLTVLVLNESESSPYINAAFRSYAGFSLTQESLAQSSKNWRDYNLVILNGLTRNTPASPQKCRLQSPAAKASPSSPAAPSSPKT